MNDPEPLRPGYHATLTALAVGQIVSWAALYYAFTAFVLPMQRELGWSKPLMMGAYTTGLALSAVLSFAVGAAIDRGHGRAVLTFGPVLGGLGFALWSMASAPWMLYAAWLVLGVALAMSLYEPAFAVVTRRYPERYRDAVATLTLVGGFASTLAFPALALLQSLLPWREVLLVVAAVLAFVIAPLQAWALRGPSMAAPASFASANSPAADMSFAEAVATPAFRLLTATFAIALFTSGALWAHMVPALASKGLSDAQALAVLVWIGPAQVAGRVLFVLLGRWLSVRRIGVVALAGAPVGCLLFAFGQSLPALLAFALLYGMANGVATLVRGALLPEYFGRAAIGRVGGLLSGIAQFARAAAPLVTAWLLLALPGYREWLLCLALIAAVGWLCFAFAKRPSSTPVGVIRPSRPRP
jgi:MFS family permease